MPRETVRCKSHLLLQELVKAKVRDEDGKPFTARDMADRLPCGKTMINDLMNGTTITCSKALGDRIAEVVSVKPQVLFAPVKSTIADRTSSGMDRRGARSASARARISA